MTEWPRTTPRTSRVRPRLTTDTLRKGTTMTLATSVDALHDDPRTARERARWRAVSSEHGIASLRHTHWLDDEFRSYADAPGCGPGGTAA